MATYSGVAAPASPARTSTMSPGVRCRTRKLTTMIMRIVGTVWRRRRPRNRATPARASRVRDDPPADGVGTALRLKVRVLEAPVGPVRAHRVVHELRVVERDERQLEEVERGEVLLDHALDLGEERLALDRVVLGLGGGEGGVDVLVLVAGGVGERRALLDVAADVEPLDAERGVGQEVQV